MRAGFAWMTMRISVVICTRDRPDDLFRAIVSLVRQVRLPDEIVVVDSGTRLIPETKMAALGERVALVNVRSRPGLPHQRNEGIRVARGDVIQFLDDDAELPQHYLETIEREFAADRSLDCVVGRVVDCGRRSNPGSNGTRVIISALSRVFLLPTHGDGHLKTSGFMASANRLNRRQRVDALGGCLCCRSEILREIGFDETLDGYAWMEDTDFARSFKSRGHTSLFLPDLCLLHYTSPSARQDQGRLSAMKVRNHYYLYRKHAVGRPVEAMAFWWSMLGLVLTNGVIGGLSGASSSCRTIMNLKSKT